MKILTISGNYPPCTVGGAEICAQIVCQGLAAMGHQVAVLTCGPRDESETDGGVTIHRVASPNLFWSRDRRTHPKLAWAGWYALQNYNPKVRRLVAREIVDLHPDILVTHTLENFGASVWASAAANNVPIVHVLHDHSVICRRSDCFKDGARCRFVCSACRALTSGARFMARHVSGVVGVSNYMIGVHRAVFSGARFETIYNPIGDQGGEVRVRIYDPLDVSYGYIGRIEQKKGLETLLRVFATDTPPGRLYVAGSGEARYVDDIKRRFAKFENISFMGWQRPGDFFRLVDYLVFPSLLNEAFGRVVAEALSFGVPVIVSGRGGTPEALVPGVGRIFEPDDPDDLEKCIQGFRLDRSTYNEVSERARASSARFSTEAVVSSFSKFLCEIVSVSREAGPCG